MNNTIQLRQGDITKIATEAIVNAANPSLMGGGGVDGAIHKAGGNAILAECQKIVGTRGPLQPGEAVITTAGNMPSNFVIHTVGPVWKDGNSNESDILKLAYQNSLALADVREIISIAFPNISTGVYGFPKEIAAKVAVETVRDFLDNGTIIASVIFVCYDKENMDIYQQLLK